MAVQGSKVGSIKNLRRSLKSGQAGPIRYIPKGDGDKPGEITVRFLEEPDEWFNFKEHWDESLNKSYPCVGDDCPGCRTEERLASRYLANALDIETDKVIAIQMAKDLTNKLLRKYERFGTITDRDYVLVREGQGLKTEYDCEYEDPMKRRVQQYELLDLQDVLDKAFAAVFNDDDDDDDEPEEDAPRGRRATGAKKSAARPRRQSEEEEEEEDDAPRRPRVSKSKASPKGAGRRKPEPEPEEEEEEYEEEEYEEEEEVDDEDGGGDDIEAPEDPSELDDWEVQDLRDLAEAYEIDLGKTRVKSAIVQKLVDGIYE